MKKFEFNKEAKSNLAKLLATENLTVEHRKVKTAYFDLQKRLLVVPIWKEMNADISILYHWRSNITNSGISLFDEDSRVKKFIEKPKEIDNKDDWVNAGIYYFSNNHIINEIEKYDDFGKDLFPKLLGLGYNIFGLKKSVELIAVDTPELLKNNLANQ